MNITLWLHVNDVTQMLINKEHYWLTLTLLRLEVRSRSHDISMFCIENCKQPEVLVSSKATALRMICFQVKNLCGTALWIIKGAWMGYMV